MSEPKYAPILENEGFRNIAYAIRQSTVTVAYRPKNQRLYELRYGLGQDLARKAQYEADFIQELAAFMQSYNDETVRVFGRTNKQYRKLIATEDIECIVNLVDEYDSRTICRLLVAFGYARDPKEKPEENPELAVIDGKADAPSNG